MTPRRRIGLITLALSSCIACAITANPSRAETSPVCAVPELPPGFRFATASVHGAALHYIIGGSGPGLILLHGFPEDSSAWLRLLEPLSRRFTVVAPDMRGVGASTSPLNEKYDALTLASDIKVLAAQLGLTQPYVVGHDMGAAVAYALARLHPEAVRGAMLIEGPLPGIDPWDKIAAAPATWHINFQ